MRSLDNVRRSDSTQVTDGEYVLKMKNALILITLLLSLAVAGQTQTALAQAELRPARVGLIEFYGTAGLDVDKVRAALPVHEGETFPTLSALDDMKPKIEETVQRVTGRPTTDISLVSPGQDVWLIYIGLSGTSVKSFRLNPAPKGTARLPAAALDVYRQVDAAFLSAMQRGASGEDDSKGYLLSSNDAALRAKQMAMHEYAARHEGEIRTVLRLSADNEQRQIAAELLGYVNQSRRQIADLVWASHDPDDTVRNNATRALGVLARSDPKVAARIPAAGFIEMLSSGGWTDRNKASGLLAALTKWREPQLLAALRAQALESLLEMARWRSGHAYYARAMLGRIAGIEETRLQQLAWDNDQLEVIVKAAQRKQ
jgi:hypothetical protein